MVERIKEIILSEGLTSGSFADLIGVQRSSMSHILNGRNNPSLDFIIKTLHHFPKINPEWLLTGVGDMLRSSAENQPASSSRARSIFDSVQDAPSKPVAAPETPSIPVAAPEIPSKPAPAPEPVVEPTPVVAPKPIEIQRDPVKIDQRYVDKVLIFYSDRTYDEFLKTQKPEI